MSPAFGSRGTRMLGMRRRQRGLRARRARGRALGEGRVAVRRAVRRAAARRARRRRRWPSCRGTGAATGSRPREINYRANIDALKRVGVTDLVSVSACGSLREELAPGTFVLVDQFIDRTLRARDELLRHRARRARLDGATRCARGSATARAGRARARASPARRGGTYLAMEGPQFSSLRRIALVSQLGLRRDRHDQHARGQARPRSGALLRERRDGDGLRLLAPGSTRDVEVAQIVAVLTSNAEQRARAGRPRRGSPRRRARCPARRAATARSTTR